ncbi:MAG TPA: hypothetical protein DIU15_02110 [Deltaproteobacteria bacterium]|nr:hypothetical protein [Deltaproteobacteria bacterium]HCP44813.1 hypothetical protein [Deltaproteobacteria bacterium]
MGDGEPASGSSRPRRRGLSVLQPPLLGGLLGGSAVGMAESLLLLGASFGTRDYSGMIYAILLYGGVGLALGVALGLLALCLTVLVGEAPEEARSWTLAFLGVACPLGYLVAHDILNRNLYDSAGLPSDVQSMLMGSVLVFALCFYALSRNALKKTFFSFMLLPLGTGSVFGGILLFALMMAFGNMLDNRASQDVVPRPVAAELERRPNILLVVVDSLRADALAAYGRPGVVTPRLDGLAATSVVYDEAIAASPKTRSSFASLLTSTVPCRHGATGEVDVLRDELDTLAEVLQRHGYTTGALVNSLELTASYNFDQGYDTFRFLRPEYPLRASESSVRLTLYGMVRAGLERYVLTKPRVERFYRDAAAVTDQALSWLRVHGRERWFLVVHYMDPHEPYRAHGTKEALISRLAEPNPASDQADRLRAAYDSEVTHMDRHFGRLLDYLAEHDLDDETAVVFTADHGEQFGDHGGFWHGSGLYDEQLRVPLIVRYPRASNGGGVRVRDQVRLIDVAPTVAELAGAPRGAGWQGFSLRREYALRQPKDRLAFAQTDEGARHLLAVRGHDWKLIREVSDGASEQGAARDQLFFLRTDPLEEVDLSSDPSATWAFDRRRRDLASLRLGACGVSESPGEKQQPISQGECNALRALGFGEVAATRCPVH